MSCYHPLLAVDNGLDSLTGKHRIKILPQRVDANLKLLRDKFGDSLLLLPCGHCIGCLKQKKSSWAVRIMLEASLYKANSFITLTYDEAHLPANKKPDRKVIQDFIKRLREAIDVKIRYFYCGEVGTHGERGENPHYHAIIFGYDFPDKKVLKRTPNGSIIYRSKLLESLWTYGISSVGDVEPGSSSYVAQYADKKKLSGVDDGSFIGMSLKPGLGASNFNMKWFKSDTIYCAMGEATIPRYFHKLLEGLKPEFYEAWKKARKDRCSQRVGNQFEHGMYEEEAYLYDEKVSLIKYIKQSRCYL